MGSVLLLRLYMTTHELCVTLRNYAAYYVLLGRPTVHLLASRYALIGQVKHRPSKHSSITPFNTHLLS